MVPIRQMPMPKLKYPLKCPYGMKPTRIVVHNTANDATAEEEVRYMQGNLKLGGFHAVVDDKEIIECSPFDRNTWNATDGNGPGNRRGIAVEICYSKSGGPKFDQAEKNAAEYIAMLLNRYGWKGAQLTRHYDYYKSKRCPHRTMDKGWSRFMLMVADFQQGVAPAAPAPASQPAAAPAAKPAAAAVKPSVYYRVKTQKHGWLPQVNGLTDYAGYQNSPITAVSIKVSTGDVKYRVHVKGGKWLPYVTGYSTVESKNGYAGDGKKPIDAVEIVYLGAPVLQYRVAAGGSYYPWQLDNETNNGQDGYAGVLGRAITSLQIGVK